MMISFLWAISATTVSLSTLPIASLNRMRKFQRQNLWRLAFSEKLTWFAEPSPLACEQGFQHIDLAINMWIQQETICELNHTWWMMFKYIMELNSLKVSNWIDSCSSHLIENRRRNYSITMYSNSEFKHVIDLKSCHDNIPPNSKPKLWWVAVRLYYANSGRAVFSHLITAGEGRSDCIMYKWGQPGRFYPLNEYKLIP